MPTSSETRNGSYFALVIGINHYRKPLPSLKTAVNDAQEIARVLSERYGFGVQLLLDENATRANILSTLVHYRRSLHENDNLLIYYAGHGVKDGDDSYWWPADSEGNNYANWISGDDLTHAVLVLPARHVLVISDSCYSGRLMRAAEPDFGSDDGHEFLQKELDSKSRNVMSSGGDEPVSDAGSNNHSTFANALLRAFDQTNKEAITARKLFNNFVLEQVGGSSEQMPEYRPIGPREREEGDFVFPGSRGVKGGWIEPLNGTSPVPGAGKSEVLADAGPGFGKSSSDAEVRLGNVSGRIDCATATAEALRLSLKARMLDRVDQNLGCRRENVSDEQAQLMVAHVFDDSNFPQYHQFLDGLWKTPLATSVDLCLASHQAIYAANFDGLAWLFSNTPKNRIQSCSGFNNDLVSSLALVGKERTPTLISQLTNSGLSLNFDEYSLFRNTYKAYIETPYPYLKWAADSFAPPTVADFRRAKARAEADLASTSPVFTSPDQSSERAKEEYLQRMSEYCPEHAGYCSSDPIALVTVPPEPTITQREFIDHETGLMWTARVADYRMNWPKAGTYCDSLRQGGYQDWRLPQLEELLRLFDASESMNSDCKRSDRRSPTSHIKKGLDPGCGDVWSGKKSARTMSLGGYIFDYAWLFDFVKGSPTEGTTRWIGNADVADHHVLCVRGAAK